MANWCSIYMVVHFGSDKEAHNFEYYFQAVKEHADSEDKGVLLGSDRYLFNVYIELCGNMVTIQGQAKWCVCEKSVREFSNRLIPFNAEIMTLEYEEQGCLLFGKYERFFGKDASFTQTVLPAEHKAWNDVWTDGFYESLENGLRKDGITREVA